MHMLYEQEIGPAMSKKETAHKFNEMKVTTHPFKRTKDKRAPVNYDSDKQKSLMTNQNTPMLILVCHNHRIMTANILFLH